MSRAHYDKGQMSYFEDWTNDEVAESGRARLDRIRGFSQSLAEFLNVSQRTLDMAADDGYMSDAESDFVDGYDAAIKQTRRAHEPARI